MENALLIATAGETFFASKNNLWYFSSTRRRVCFQPKIKPRNPVREHQTCFCAVFIIAMASQAAKSERDWRLQSSFQNLAVRAPYLRAKGGLKPPSSPLKTP